MSDEHGPSPKKSKRHLICDRDFYDVPCIELARRLLGQLLVSDDGHGRVSGRIVETEAYPGGDDRASNSFGGRKTPGNAAMFMRPGTAYVYLTYGMHHCMNISSRGDGAAVLLRAVEPIEGLELMRSRRGLKLKDGGSKLKDTDLCNGPGKLCRSFAVTKENADRKDLTSSADIGLWIELTDDDDDAKDVICAPRIGIGSVVKEWASKPFRFYLLNSSCVSVRDKQAEMVPS